MFGACVLLQLPVATPAVTVHEMPAGELVTVPLPVPPPTTFSPCVWNTACTARGFDIVT